MRRFAILPMIGLLAVGCSRSDVEILGRIGAKVNQRADAIWQSDANARLLNALPRLQPTRGPNPKSSDPTPIDNGGVTPRLEIQ